MAKQKKRRPIKLPPYLMAAKEKVLRILLGVIIILIAAGLIFAGVWTFIMKSDYFKVATVEIRSDFINEGVAASTSNELLRLYGGKNVFGVNLSNISRSLSAIYPDAKDIVVSLGLPDRIIAKLIFRRPVALVGDNKYYPIDEEGFVLSSINYKSLKDLPVISGIDIRRETARRSRKVSRNLGLAIELIKKLKASRFLTSWSVNTVDAGDAKNIVFYLKGGVEVRIGAEDYTNRLKVLDKTLHDTRLLMDRIKYIDLRFKDVVIGPK